MAATTDIAVEYCGVCGFYNKFVKLRRALNKVDGVGDVAGTAGREGSLEVMVAGKYLAHSRLGSGDMPDVDKLSAELAAFVADGKVPASWSAVAAPSADGEAKEADTEAAGAGETAA